jgi:AT hook motif
MEVVSIKRGRGRPKGSKSSNPKEKVIVLINGEKRGRGRPRKDQTNVEKIKVERTPSLPIVKVVAANIPALSQKIESNSESSDTVKRGRGRPRKDGSITVPVDKITRETKKKTELDEKFEKEKAQFLASHTDSTSRYVHIPTLKEIEYQKNTQVKTSAHELIIAEEIEKQKDKAFRHIMSNAAVSKPNLNKLDDVCYINFTDQGRHISFNAEVGDEIIVEWPQNWRKTETWLIDEINEENGNVRLKNTEEFYYGGINFITGPTVYGLKIKKPNKGKK